MGKPPRTLRSQCRRRGHAKQTTLTQAVAFQRQRVRATCGHAAPAPGAACEVDNGAECASHEEPNRGPPV